MKAGGGSVPGGGPGGRGAGLPLRDFGTAHHHHHGHPPTAPPNGAGHGPSTAGSGYPAGPGGAYQMPPSADYYRAGQQHLQPPVSQHPMSAHHAQAMRAASAGGPAGPHPAVSAAAPPHHQQYHPHPHAHAQHAHGYHPQQQEQRRRLEQGAGRGGAALGIPPVYPVSSAGQAPAASTSGRGAPPAPHGGHPRHLQQMQRGPAPGFPVGSSHPQAMRHHAQQQQQIQGGHRGGPLQPPMSLLATDFGFTKEQMRSLYAQIVAFKALVKRQKLPKKVLDAIKPPPLHHPGVGGPQPPRDPRAIAAMQQAVALQQQQQQQQQQRGKAAQAAAAKGAKGAKGGKKKSPAAAPATGKRPRGRPPKNPKKKQEQAMSEDDFESQLSAMRALTGGAGEATAAANGAGKAGGGKGGAAGKKGAGRDSAGAGSKEAKVKMSPEEKAKMKAEMIRAKKMMVSVKKESALKRQQEKERVKAGKAAERAAEKADKADNAEKAALQNGTHGGPGVAKKIEKAKAEKVRTKQIGVGIRMEYQSKLQALAKAPLLPPRGVTASLVEPCKGQGNVIGETTARRITEAVAGVVNREAACRRDRAVARALGELEEVMASRRLEGGQQGKKRVRAGKLMKYSITAKALKLRKLQGSIREKVLREQMDLSVMKTKDFYRTARQILTKRFELRKQEEQDKRDLVATRHKELRRGRQEWLDMVGSSQDKIRSTTKRLMQFHAKLSGDYNKVEKEDRRKRMLKALEEKDAEAYASLVREGLGVAGMPISADKNELEQLTKFLDDTENYLTELGDKVKLVKLQAAVDEGDIAMADTMTRQSGGEDTTGGSKLYDAAHSLEHSIQLPHLLAEPGLRSYQVTGLKWMTSLYKNRLNGILADEMGLGKTVQVISLFAWLMEYESNMGPHLVVVPNAVVPNWRNELKRWFPSATTCVYVGNKEVRGGIFNAHISLDATYRSNVVITTYEYTLRDRHKLAKVNWKYVVMDEAHRIKDRTSKLADAVDRLQCERRLLLTGTPLQNDLQELWSLLNYLLPKVFDHESKQAFREWFDEHLSNQNDITEEKLAKRAVVIQRLHQALEPFMLRRQVEDVEQSLPPKIAHTILCASSSLESVAYRWLSQTSTVKDIRGGFFAINNKAMELKKLCNHLIMVYPEAVLDHSMTELIRSSGKLFMLDRILMKMHKSGHRVLLFSTMTKALDILETYVKWRGWCYHRIDGTTPIEEREEAIADFNNVDRQDGSEVPFIFLLSIRAAGRGLNLQSADTVLLYDPDPNPKNEEQAIARSHRIGQVREVRVFHMESVVDKVVPTVATEDLDAMGGGEPLDMGGPEGAENLAEKQGRGGYQDSVESIIRKEIQKYKIDMANEVIDAGRFDLESTKEEKRKTLQTFLQEHVSSSGDNFVLGLKEMNRLLARGAEEIKCFDEMDKDASLWPGPLYTSVGDVPSWLQYEEKEIETAHNMLGVNVKNKMAPELERLLIYGSRHSK